MKKFIVCPRYKDTEPPEEREVPNFDPCHLCDGARVVTIELAAAYRLCVNEKHPRFVQYDAIESLREKIPE